MKKIFKKIFKKKKEAKIKKEPNKKEPNKKLPPIDYDGMGEFSRFGRP